MKTARAKLFQNGGSQAVRLPKECRFTAQREVLADEWSDKFRACLGAWSGEIPRPKQRQVRDLRDPFA